MISILFAFLILYKINNMDKPISKTLEALKAKIAETEINNMQNTEDYIINSAVIRDKIENELYPGWNLVWHDEFDTDLIDKERWNVVEAPSFKNNELQYYISENVLVKDGHLILTSHKQNYENSLYTSGAVNTKDKLEIKYGKVEVKARTPRGKGIFPAIWLLSSENDYLPEIDIMEMLGDEPTKIWMVYHWQSDKTMREYSFFEGPDFTQEFHIYSIEWDETGIRWMIDNDLKFQIDISPSESLYLYINTAIGGNWPGNPDQSAVFPQYFEIDYVRVLEKQLFNPQK